MAIRTMKGEAIKKIAILQSLITLDLKALATASHMLEDAPASAVLNRSRVETLLYLSNDLAKNLTAIDTLSQLLISLPEES